MDIRAEIKRLLEEKDISVRQFSIKSGVRRLSIMHFLRGRNIHIKNLQKILEALGYEIKLVRTVSTKTLLQSRLGVSKNDIEEFCRGNGIEYLAVFGSILTKDFRKHSDIDILIRFKKPISFFELSDIEDALKKLFKTEHKLDVVTEKAVSPFIMSEIKQNHEVIYEEAA